jgi:hypothetical protein
MADTRITSLATGTTLHSGDWLVYVDTTDTAMAPTGTDKRLSPAVLLAGLPVFGGSGVNHASGIVPDPGASAGTTHYLREDGTWAVPASGGGSVGGTTGQIQYNAAGVFGGFAVSGDGTLNTSTGALTITKTSGAAFADSATTDTTNAANIAYGTLPAARLPNPSVGSLGGVQAIAAVGSRWINAISTAGVPTLTQPAFSDLTGTATAAQLPSTGLVVNQHTSLITADTDAATITFNLAVSDWHTVTLAGNRILAISNEGTNQQFTIVLVQDATGSRTVTWWSGIKWAGGPAPVLTTTAGKADVFTFKQLSAGAYYGFVAGQSL